MNDTDGNCLLKTEREDATAVSYKSVSSAEARPMAQSQTRAGMVNTAKVLYGCVFGFMTRACGQVPRSEYKESIEEIRRWSES